MAITLTDAAAERAKKFISTKAGVQGLRLGVRKSGCSGYAYVLDVTQTLNDDDLVFEERGVRLIVDRDSLPFLDGTELDYVRDGLNHSFKFRNPNVKDACGCGESVAF